jgi:hypothetical protein
MGTSQRKKFSTDFEGAMADLIENQPERIQDLVRDMGIYFAQFRTNGQDTAYRALIRGAIAQGKFTDLKFSTLNYDCLLEMTLSEEGNRIAYLEGGTLTAQPTVWKPHGSCNWVPDLGGGGIYGITLIVRPTARMVEAPIKVIQPHELRKWASNNQSLFPAMAVYARTKHSFICRNFIDKVRTEWTAAVMSASKVAVVGVRPNPKDEHIWKPLAHTRAKLFFVGGEQDFQVWRKENRSTLPTVHLGTNFKGALPSLLAAL